MFDHLLGTLLLSQGDHVQQFGLMIHLKGKIHRKPVIAPDQIHLAEQVQKPTKHRKAEFESTVEQIRAVSELPQSRGAEIAEAARGSGYARVAVDWDLESEMGSRLTKIPPTSLKWRMRLLLDPRDSWKKTGTPSANSGTLQGDDEPIFHGIFLPERG